MQVFGHDMTIITNSNLVIIHNSKNNTTVNKTYNNFLYEALSLDASQDCCLGMRFALTMETSRFFSENFCLVVVLVGASTLGLTGNVINLIDIVG